MALTIEQRKIRSRKALADAVARSLSVRVSTTPTPMQRAFQRALEGR